METSEQKNKYYTPTIQEFHVGFECEKKSLINNSYEPYDRLNYITKWEQVVIRPFDAPTKVESKEELSWFRVKYLDQEDIESLGFNKITDDCFDLPIKEYRGRLNQEVRILIRQTILIYLAMDINYNDKDNLILFTGNIKNKSELKKLMLQLNILKDEE